MVCAFEKIQYAAVAQRRDKIERHGLKLLVAALVFDLRIPEFAVRIAIGLDRDLHWFAQVNFAAILFLFCVSQQILEWPGVDFLRPLDAVFSRGPIEFGFDFLFRLLVFGAYIRSRRRSNRRRRTRNW